MAIFAKKPNTEDTLEVVAKTVSKPLGAAAVSDVVSVKDAPKHYSRPSSVLVTPRLSEKAGAANRLNKYIFTIAGKMNKLELRKAVEKQYGVKIAQVNMITMKSKSRRFGRRVGTIAAFKKAIVTLTKDSKKIDLVEPS